MDRLSDAANDETDRYFVARTLADVRGRALGILYIPSSLRTGTSPRIAFRHCQVSMRACAAGERAWCACTRRSDIRSCAVQRCCQISAQIFRRLQCLSLRISSARTESARLRLTRSKRREVSARSVCQFVKRRRSRKAQRSTRRGTRHGRAGVRGSSRLRARTPCPRRRRSYPLRRCALQGRIQPTSRRSGSWPGPR
jgi:hypothetical protein